jgi:hypothetical protein
VPGGPSALGALSRFLFSRRLQAVRVLISLAGSACHATPYCPLLKASHEKAAERGPNVTRIVCISMNEARERRRKACGA